MNIKGIIGLCLIIIGILLGIYVGFWLCFVGGIIQIISEIRSDILNSFNIGIGIIKIMFSSFIGYIIGVIFIIPGMLLIKD